MNNLSYFHCLITRFNIVQNWYGTTDKNGNSIQTDAWLETRFDLFEHFCLPSVRNQTVSDFVWIILFDVNTAGEYRDRILSYGANFPQFLPVFLEPNASEVKAVLDAIQFEPEHQFLITTRLDNDDAIHEGFLEEVRDQFSRQADVFICFNRGYQLDSTNRTLLPVEVKNNHFVSRIEQRSANMKTVLCDHSNIDSIARVNYVNNSIRNWIEVIHEGNVANRLRHAAPELLATKLRSFHITTNISLLNSIREFGRYLTSATKNRLTRS